MSELFYFVHMSCLFCSPQTIWAQVEFNERYFTFIKRAFPGMVLFVRQHTHLELALAAGTTLMILTSYAPANVDAAPFLNVMISGMALLLM